MVVKLQIWIISKPVQTRNTKSIGDQLWVRFWISFVRLRTFVDSIKSWVPTKPNVDCWKLQAKKQKKELHFCQNTNSNSRRNGTHVSCKHNQNKLQLQQQNEPTTNKWNSRSKSDINNGCLLSINDVTGITMNNYTFVTKKCKIIIHRRFRL